MIKTLTQQVICMAMMLYAFNSLYPEVQNDEIIIDIFKKYLNRNGISFYPSDQIKVKSLCNRSIKVILRWDERIMPSPLTEYIFYPDKKIEALDIKSLTKALKIEYPKPVSAEDRENIIKAVLTYDDWEAQKIIINGLSDIPGYEKHPLDSNLANQIKVPFMSKDGMYTFYTHQELGGEVKKYCIKFDTDGLLEDISSEVIADRVGETVFAK